MVQATLFSMRSSQLAIGSLFDKLQAVSAYLAVLGLH